MHVRLWINFLIIQVFKHDLSLDSQSVQGFWGFGIILQKKQSSWPYRKFIILKKGKISENWKSSNGL